MKVTKHKFGIFSERISSMRDFIPVFKFRLWVTLSGEKVIKNRSWNEILESKVMCLHSCKYLLL